MTGEKDRDLQVYKDPPARELVPGTFLVVLRHADGSTTDLQPLPPGDPLWEQLRRTAPTPPAPSARRDVLGSVAQWASSPRVRVGTAACCVTVCLATVAAGGVVLMTSGGDDGPVVAVEPTTSSTPTSSSATPTPPATSATPTPATTSAAPTPAVRLRAKAWAGRRAAFVQVRSSRTPIWITVVVDPAGPTKPIASRFRLANSRGHTVELPASAGKATWSVRAAGAKPVTGTLTVQPAGRRAPRPPASNRAENQPAAPEATRPPKPSRGSQSPPTQPDGPVDPDEPTGLPGGPTDPD